MGPTFELERIAAAPLERALFGAVVLEPIGRDGELLFSVRGGGLWLTDGTPEGTQPFEDCPGACPVDATFLARANGLLYFTAGGENEPRNLWVTDFTARGTRRLTDLASPISPFDAPTLLVDREGAAGGQFFFTATTEDSGTELWVSEGTPESTRLQVDLRPGPDSSFPELAIAQGLRVLWVADDGLHGREVWTLDAATGEVQMLADLMPGEEPSFPHEFELLGDAALFFAETVTGVSLFRLDAGAELPTVVRDLAPEEGVRVRFFQAVGDDLAYFAVSSLDFEEGSLWVTDGTAAGTFPLTPLLKRDFSLFHPESPSPLAGKVLFKAFGPSVEELWISGGTPESTERLLRAQSISSTQRFGDLLTLYLYDASTGNELWVTDGTSEGTRRVFDLCPGPCSGTPEGPVTLRGRILFLGWDDTGLRVWSWDGRSDPEAIFEVPAHVANSLSGFWTLGDRALLFLATDQLEVWVLKPLDLLPDLPLPDPRPFHLLP